MSPPRSRISRAARPSPQGEAFDPTPANIESRVQRSTLPGGVKMSLLPTKTRGGTVVATLTIRFGDEKSLFGKAAIASITGGAADARHQEQIAPADPG